MSLPQAQTKVRKNSSTHVYQVFYVYILLMSIVSSRTASMHTPPHKELLRNPALDLIRSCAIIAVITLHIMPQREDLWIYRIFVESVSKVGVPLFLILTGYLMLDRDYATPGKIKRFLVHNWLPLVFAFEIWVVVSSLVPVARMFMDSGSLAKTIGDVLGTAFFWREPFLIHLWYMQLLIGIYLFIPALAICLRASTTNETRIWLYIVLGLFICWVFVLPTVQQILSWYGINIGGESTLGWFSGRGAMGIAFMLLGYCIRTIPVLHSCRQSMRWIIFALSLLLLWGVSALDWIETKQSFMVTSGFFPIAFFGFALFLLMEPLGHLMVRMHKFSRVCLRISKLSFGIYMVHLPMSMLLNAVLPDFASHGFIHLAIVNPFTIGVLSFACCLLLEQIPFAKRWMLLIK